MESIPTPLAAAELEEWPPRGEAARQLGVLRGTRSRRLRNTLGARLAALTLT